MRAEFFDFLPTFKLFLATNHRPVIRGTDHAIWRRIRLVPFTVTIPDAEQDKHYADKLRAEAPGILAWAVRGCLAWQRDGLGMPAEVETATATYRAEMDRLGPFFEDCCLLDSGATTPFAALWERYRTWAGAANERPLSQQEFRASLRERGLQPRKGTRGIRMWDGVALVAVDGGDSPISSSTLSHGSNTENAAIELPLVPLTAAGESREPWQESDMFDPPERTA